MGRTICTRTQTVLALHVFTSKAATFVRDEEMSETHINALTIPRALYEELGSPHQITVSIEPGDKLNEEGE